MTDKLRQAAEIGFNYIQHALVLLDQAYGDHPAMKAERQSIVDDLEAVQKALSERHECETCAAKRKKLTEAGLLKSPLRDVDMGIDRGAWADVPDATKWVDELRGDEPEEPPKREWVKLTLKEIDVIERYLLSKNRHGNIAFALEIEAKLREKNT
jgi:hypothetical protein